MSGHGSPLVRPSEGRGMSRESESALSRTLRTCQPSYLAQRTRRLVDRNYHGRARGLDWFRSRFLPGARRAQATLTGQWYAESLWL
jgi:hypothetical protein